MFETLLQSKIASFRLGGERVDLVPAEMTKSADSYSRRVGDLLVVLDFVTLGEDCFRWHVTLRNTGKGRTAQITELYGADIRFPVDGEAVWETLHGDNWSENTFLPIDSPFPDCSVIEREATEGRSSYGMGFPYFDVTSEAGAAVFAIGWSGQWAYKMRRIGKTATLRLGFSDCDTYLNPGESFRSAGLIVCGDNNLTAARQKLRRILREKLSPAAKNGGTMTLPVSLQGFDRYFPTGTPWNTPDPNWATDAGQLRALECAKKVGLIENFWLDAAWFREGFPNGVGNYDFTPGFPNGLASLSRAVHEAGMTFMLWFEVERVNKNSDTAKEHPEWMLWNGVEDNPYRMFTLGREDAYQWLRGNLIRMIRDNGVDIYRQDFNRGPLPYWRRHEEPGRTGWLENSHITNLYRLWDELLREFPGLLIDNCAGGGGRLDYELLSRSVSLWRSDSGCYPTSKERPTDIWHQNQTLGLSRYIPYHATCSWVRDANIFRSAATMGIALTPEVMRDDFDETEMHAPIRELLARRDLWEGDFYPFTEPTLLDDGWCAYQLAKGERGFAAFFRRECAQADRLTVQLQGIDPDGDYEVTVSDEAFNESTAVMKGAELADFTAVIPERRASLIVRYCAVEV